MKNIKIANEGINLQTYNNEDYNHGSARKTLLPIPARIKVSILKPSTLKRKREIA